jgi:hypothetical protein
MDESRLRLNLTTARALIAGELSLGATFWVGLIIADLTVAMLYVWFSAAFAVAGPGLAAAIALVAQVGLILLAVYLAALVAAMVRAARASPDLGSWRFVAVALALAHLFGALALVWRSFSV